MVCGARMEELEKPTIQVPYMKPTTIGDMYGTIKRLMTNVSENIV